MTRKISRSDESDRTSTRLVVHGRVQGVGFRWWTKRIADELDLSGSIRNLDDGSVEVLATGSIDAIERMRRRLRVGPPGARVDRLEESTGITLPDPSFAILR